MADLIAFIVGLFPHDGNQDERAALVLFVVAGVLVAWGMAARHHREHWEDER